MAAPEDTILAMDVGRSMHGRKSQQALDGAEMLIKYKILNGFKKDTITIIPFGTIAQGIDDQYQHVTVLQPERYNPGVRHLHALAALRKRYQQTQHGNFLDALVVCYGIARAIRQPPGRRPNKRRIRIVMITDAAGETFAPPVPDGGGAADEGSGQADASQATGGAATSSQHMEPDSDSDSDSSTGSDSENRDDRIDRHTVVMDALVRAITRDNIALDVIGVGFGGADAGVGPAEWGASGTGMASSSRSSSSASSSSSSSSASSSSSCAAAAEHPPSMRLDPAMLDSKRRNEAAIVNFARLVGGQVLPASRAIKAFSGVLGTTKAATKTFTGILDIAGDIMIKVMAFAFTRTPDRPTVKCILPRAGYNWDGNSTAADEDEDGKNSNAIEGGDKAMNDDRSGRSLDAAAAVDAVEVKRVYQTVDADTHEPVDSEGIQSAFQFGTGVLQLQESQRNDMAIRACKSLKVISFVPRANVPRYHFMSTVDAIVPDPESPASCRALSSLATALHEQDAVALVRFIKRNREAGVNPLLGCLTPHLCPASAAASAESTGRPETRSAFAYDPPYDCLFFNYLPCEEHFRDCRFRPFDTEADAVPTAAQEEAALALVDSMNLMNVPVGGEEQEGKHGAVSGGAGAATEEAQRPETQFNPVLYRVNKLALDRAMDDNAPIPELPSSIREQLEMPRAIASRQQVALQQFARAFPLERRDAGTGLGASRAAAAVAASTRAGDAARGATGLLGKKRGAEMAGLSTTAGAGAEGGAGKAKSGLAAAARVCTGASAEKRARVDATGDAVLELVGIGGAVSEQYYAVLAGAGIEEGIRNAKGAGAGNPPVDRVGPVDPIGDMRKMVARKDKGLLGAALGGMVGVVARLARDPAQHARAVQCLRAMREVCLAHRSKGVFNSLLRKIRGVAQANVDGMLPACQVQIGRVEGDYAEQPAPLPTATAAQRQAEAGLHDALRQASVTLIRLEESTLVVMTNVMKALQQDYLQPVVRSAGAGSGGTSLEAGTGKGVSEDEFDDDDDMD